METAAAARPPLVLMNPHAARLTDDARRATIRHEVELAVHARFGLVPDWAPETHEGALRALRDVAGRAAVVAIGGDGTVREAAGALVGTDIPLAIVPGGTGNVLAGTLGLGGMSGAMRVIRAGASRRLDLGRAHWGAVGETTAAHERLFTVACGMGFDARVMAAAEHEWKRRLRFGAYIGAAVREAVRLRPTTFHIEADGAVIEIVGLVVLVANCGEIVPGRVGMREPLDPTDGRLDLIVIGGRDVLRGLRGAADVLLAHRRARRIGHPALRAPRPGRGRPGPADADRRRRPSTRLARCLGPAAALRSTCSCRPHGPECAVIRTGASADAARGGGPWASARLPGR